MDALISPRRRAVLQAFGAATLLAGCGRSSQVARAHEFRGPTMGTSYSLKLYAPGLGSTAAEAAHAAVAGAFADIVERMSLHDAGSELSRFNRHALTAPFAVSAETFAVFEQARQASARSAGAFDATIAPAVAAWGFGPAARPGIPAPELLRAARETVGWRGLGLDPAALTVAKHSPEISVDFSGIAKGHAVDVASRALDALGHARYLVEAGGEIRTRGRNADGRPWQIAIERPDAVPQRAYRIVPLTDLSMATSGDYRIYFERDGERYCHEIDPASGCPIRNGLASVTVVAPACAFADAMATALMVMGPTAGLAFAVEQGLAAHFIARDADGRLREFTTPAFAALGGHPVAGKRGVA